MRVTDDLAVRFLLRVVFTNDAVSEENCFGALRIRVETRRISNCLESLDIDDDELEDAVDATEEGREDIDNDEVEDAAEATEEEREHINDDEVEDAVAIIGEERDDQRGLFESGVTEIGQSRRCMHITS